MQIYRSNIRFKEQSVFSRARALNSGSKLISTFALFLLFLAAPGNGFGVLKGAMATELDHAIIDEALAGTVCNRNLAVIVEGAYYQNSKYNAVDRKPERHFETKNLERSIKYINSERKKALHAALEAGPKPDMRTRTLFHFGMLLHTVNNFYLNTDYLEKLIEKLEKSGNHNFDPYDLPLVDWSEAGESGKYRVLSEAERKNRVEKKLSSTTYAKAARGLAIKEVRRQWDTLEGLLRSRYFSQADIIIAAPKTASCEKLIPDYVENHGLHAQESTPDL